jgi:hypothetical protein
MQMMQRHTVLMMQRHTVLMMQRHTLMLQGVLMMLRGLLMA